MSLTDLMAIARLQAQAAAYVGAQAATRVLATKGGIDPLACDRLATVSTVDDSGALGERPPVYLAAMPQVALQAWNVSPGLAGVIGVTMPQAGGVWMERQLAQVLGAQVGDRLPTPQGVLVVGAIFEWPQDGRDQRLSFSILIPQVTAEPLDECWLKAWPVVDGNDLLLRSAMRVEAGSGYLPIGRVNASLGMTLDSAELFRLRLTRNAPLLLLAIGLALGYAMSGARRLEYASAQHIGQRKPDQMMGCAIETCAWAATAAAVTTLTLWVVTRVANLTDPASLMAIVARGPVIAAAGAMIGS
ncbi:MAG: hypothetical protein FWC46_01140, partial [Actinomycetia bacterium]|nr:hypothetical protein [Actinomycetes bacterium]